MPGHGLKSCSDVYPIPDGAKYVVICRQGDYRNKELLLTLKEQAVQVVLDGDGFASVFVWWPAIPQDADAVDPVEGRVEK